MSDSPIRAAEDEALAIAEGLPRAEVERRAQQAFESANEIRARYRGLPDTAKRAVAVTRARTWADILRHMDAMEQTEFCGCPGDETPPAIVRAVWTAWDWLVRVTWCLNVPVVVQAFRDILGAEPIDFYQRPGTYEGRPCDI